MKDFIDLNNLSENQIYEIIELSQKLKEEKHSGIAHHLLKGKILAMIFQKASTRTRVSFEAGIYQLGGTAIFLSYDDIQLGRGEPVLDTAKVLDRYVDCIMIRTFSQEDVENLAKSTSIPVINGLTDKMHPCQAISDLFTIYEKKKKLKGLKIAYIGDGNNMAHSLLQGCSLVGMDISIATPLEYKCDQDITNQALENAQQSGSIVEITSDPIKAAKDADIIYTDTWISMGQENEKEFKIKLFKNYQVNSNIMSYAKPDALFMHCLPAYRGFEVTEDVIDGKQSVIYDQAENRLHVQKAIMVKLMS